MTKFPSNKTWVRGATARHLLIGLALTAALAVVVAVYWRNEGRAARRPSQTVRSSSPADTAPDGSRPPASSLPAQKLDGTREPAGLPAGGGVTVFADRFSEGTAPGPRWVVTRNGDFREAAVDIVRGRLRLRAGTIGTRDDTVKHLGVRTAEAVVDSSSPIEVAAEIDWNGQANGCYLQASLYFCPTATDGTASSERDWLCFEYVGVPPGKNARAVLARWEGGNLRLLFTEGWPDQQRTGRLIGKQRVVLRIGPENVEVLENGRPLYGPAPHGLSFRRAYLYIELSSHSNYPPREIFFDDIVVRAVR